MLPPPSTNRTLGRFNIIVFFVSLFALYAGGFTTSIGAGMVFPDWPLSNGSLNPEGWLSNTAMRAEHSHRLLAGVVALLTLIMVILHFKRENRTWVRKMTYFALGLVLAQALLGGMRVLMNDVELAIPHAFLAQLFLCILASLAWVHTDYWHRSADNTTNLNGIRKASVLLVIIIFIQLIIAAVMRHKGAGLAIDTFPMSTREGDWLPYTWNFRVSIHFAHRVFALLIVVFYIPWMIAAVRNPAFSAKLRSLSFLALLLLVAQIALGASIIWLHRMAIPTTFHVIIGAFLLANIWSIAFLLHRPFLVDESGDNQQSVRTKPLTERSL